MTTPRDTMQPAPVLGEPLPTPDPAPDCARCEETAARRAAAREAGDWARVSDCNVEIRRCTH